MYIYIQLSDKNVYQEAHFKKQMLPNLVHTSNQFFKGLKTKGFIAEKGLKHFTCCFQCHINIF